MMKAEYSTNYKARVAAIKARNEQSGYQGAQ
jgi:hypothetical protein